MTDPTHGGVNKAKEPLTAPLTDLLFSNALLQLLSASYNMALRAGSSFIGFEDEAMASRGFSYFLQSNEVCETSTPESTKYLAARYPASTPGRVDASGEEVRYT